MGTDCNGCGCCCDPVITNYSKTDVKLGAYVIPDPEDKRWFLEDLTAVSFVGATERMRELAFVQWVGPHYFWRCVHFDAVSRTCTNYDNRPPVCQGYPWFGNHPDPLKYLPHECSFNADVGRPVEVHLRKM